MTMIGADVEELERLAGSFSAGAQELRELSSQLVGTIEAARDWQGPDATRCKEQWGSFAAVQLTGVGDALETAGRLLAENAREQEVASGESSYGLMSFFGDVKTLFDFISKPITALLKAKNLVDFFRALAMPATGFVALSRVEALLKAMDVLRGAGKTGLLGLLGRVSLPLTIFSGLKDLWDGGGREGWRGWATRGFGLAGAAGAATLLIGGTALVVSAPVTATVAAVAVVGYGLWSAGNYVYDNWDTIRGTAGRVWEGLGNGLDSAKEWARGLLGPAPRPAGA